MFNYLPPEILIHVQRQLDVQHMLRCRQVCRIFNKIIQGSSELQYFIELEREGYTDTGLSKQVSYVERLKVLLDRSNRWSRLDWHQRTTIPISGKCQAYELVAGVFVKSMNFKHFAAATLPSAAGATQELAVRQDVGIPFRDFALDPSQDLVIFLEANDENVKLHCRTLSGNTSHPRARNAIISQLIPNRSPPRAIIQLINEVVGLFIEFETPAESYLYMWNWKEGTLLTEMESSYLEDEFIVDLAFVSNTTFCLTSLHNKLLIYRFSDNGSTKHPELLTTLCLPTVVNRFFLEELSIHTSPFLDAALPLCTFTAKAASRLYVVTLGFTDATNTVERFWLFIPVHVFETYIIEGLSRAVLWDDWGPRNTRMVPYTATESSWLRYVGGSRFIFETVEELATVMNIFDFNPGGGRAYGSSPSDGDVKITSDTEKDETHLPTSKRSDGPTNTITPFRMAEPLTKIKAGKVFAADVVSTLPYSSNRRAMGKLYNGLMIDEERVVALVESREGILEELHVHTF